MTVETKYLEKFKDEQIFVDIYTDYYDESDFGYVIDYNDDFLVIEKFDNESNPDGLSIFLRDNITRIRWGGNEITSASSLIDKEKRMKIVEKIDLTSLEMTLKSVNRIFGHVTIHIQNIDKDICFIGQIEEIDNETIVLNEFGTMSSLDRKYILISLNDITRIDAFGKYEKNLLRIHNKNN